MRMQRAVSWRRLRLEKTCYRVKKVDNGSKIR